MTARAEAMGFLILRFVQDDSEGERQISSLRCGMTSKKNKKQNAWDRT
jgi:hypothetical protein